MTLFRGKDGVIRFADNRVVARQCGTADGGVEVQVQVTAPGSTHYMPAPELLALSDGVLPGVLTVGRRKGAAVPTMRARGLAASISP
eukprot:5122179-Pleurochrysis_carterae.AAC.1